MYTLSFIQKKLADMHPNILRKDINFCCSTILNGIIESVKSDNRVEIRQLGSFFSKSFKKKIGRDPKTGERIILTEGRKTLRFRASKNLLSRINKSV